MEYDGTNPTRGAIVLCLRIVHYFADDLQVFKRDVDRFSARKELCTCQVKVWCENEEAPKHLAQRVLIKGAKKQCNFLTVTSPTTCLTSEWKFTLSDGLNDLHLFRLEPVLPSSTPSSKIRIHCL